MVVSAAKPTKKKRLGRLTAAVLQEKSSEWLNASGEEAITSPT
jgi:hypothetical protein